MPSNPPNVEGAGPAPSPAGDIILRAASDAFEGGGRPPDEGAPSTPPIVDDPAEHREPEGPSVDVTRVVEVPEPGERASEEPDVLDLSVLLGSDRPRPGGPRDRRRSPAPPGGEPVEQVTGSTGHRPGSSWLGEARSAPPDDPLLHPDPARRAEALDGRDMTPEDVARALDDPDDMVRAAAVHAAARTGRAGLRLLVPLIGARRWPRAQSAALDVLPGVVAGDEGSRPVTNEELDELLWAIGALEPPPDGRERAALGRLLPEAGPERVAQRLRGPARLRLGAVRLLAAGGAVDWLRPLIGEHDLDPELEAAARLATGPTQGPAPSPSVSWEDAGDESILAALARGLADPDGAVRARAGAALGDLDPAVVAGWAASRLGGDDRGAAALAAHAVEHLRLRTCAAAVLDRACSTAPDERGPYLRALAALRLSGPDLAELVATRPADDRAEAVRIAWRLGGRPALPSLAPFLEDSAGLVRVAVLDALGESGEAAAIHAALQALTGDSSVAVRAAAIRILARAEPDARLTGLRLAMDDPDPDVRASALDTLGPGSTAEGGQLLHRALAEPDPRVWQAAVRQVASSSERDPALAWSALRRAGSSQRVELLRLLERTAPERLGLLAHAHARDADASDRTLAIELAARAGDRHSTALAVESLQDPDPVVRRAAAAALCVLRSPSAIPALARALLDPSTDVRLEAVRALGLVDDDEVPAILIPALTDPESRVAELAGEALVRAGSATVARQLTQALSAPDLRRPARRLLERMGARATPFLVEAVVEGDPETRAEAGELLAALRRPADVAPQLAALDPDERLRAVEVLGAMGGPEAAEAMLPALTDPDHRVRVRAIVLLGDAGDERVAEALRRTLRTDPSHEAAAAAAQALRRLGVLPVLDESERPDEGGEGPEDAPGA